MKINHDWYATQFLNLLDLITVIQRKLDNIKIYASSQAMHTMVLFKELTSKIKGYLSNGVRISYYKIIII